MDGRKAYLILWAFKEVFKQDGRKGAERLLAIWMTKLHEDCVIGDPEIEVMKCVFEHFINELEKNYRNGVNLDEYIPLEGLPDTCPGSGQPQSIENDIVELQTASIANSSADSDNAGMADIIECMEPDGDIMLTNVNRQSTHPDDVITKEDEDTC